MSSGAPAGKPLLAGRERAAMLLYRTCTIGGQVWVETQRGASFRVDDPACAAALQAELPQGNCITLRQANVPFTDCRPISILSVQAVRECSRGYGRAVDPRRFRANIVLDFDPTAAGISSPEDFLVGSQILIGDTAQLRVTERDPRCRIVTLDPETAEQNAGLMRHLDRYFEGKLGVYAATKTPGRVRVGDPVRLVADDGVSVTFPALQPSKQG